MDFGKVVKTFNPVLLKTRNPGFDLSHSLLPPSCAEMFSNLWTSSQAVLTFDAETFGDPLIDIHPQAKAPHFSWTHSSSFDLETEEICKCFVVGKRKRFSRMSGRCRPK